MFALIILVIFGLGTAYFATQNTMPTILYIGNYRIADVPMYFVIIGSLLLGVFISWIISIIDRSPDKTIDALKEEKHDLEIENARFKEKKSESPSFADRLKHSFS